MTAIRPSATCKLEGARDIGIEFHSLSKTYNMTGWRIGMAVGNADMIRALFQIKANLDSGVPQAVQEMAMEALTGPQDSVADNVAIYQRRRDRVLQAVRNAGLEVATPRAQPVHLGQSSRRFHVGRVRAAAAGGSGRGGHPWLQLWALRRGVYPPFPHHPG